jgi:hypothetical protein
MIGDKDNGVRMQHIRDLPEKFVTEDEFAVARRRPDPR